MTLAAFVRACWFCARITHGRRFCTGCGAKLTSEETTT